MSAGLIDHIKHYVALSGQDEELLASLQPIAVKKKHYFLQEGQICKSLYFVEKGCLRLFFINQKGNEQITHFALENWWLADYMSFTRQSISSFYIQAVENSEVICLDQPMQEELLKEIPQLERYFRIIAQRAYAASQTRIKYLHDYSKEESYQHFITSFPEFVQRIPQYMLASYLGLTPEYLSEIRKNKH